MRKGKRRDESIEINNYKIRNGNNNKYFTLYSIHTSWTDEPIGSH